MPLYEYKCDACGRRFELIRKFSDPQLENCPHCESSSVRRLMSAPAIQFKGSGFYITDYARQGGDAGGSEKSKDTKSDGASSSSGSTDAASGSAKTDSSAKPAAAPASASAAKD